MFAVYLSAVSALQPFLQNKVFAESLEWLEKHAATAAPGLYPLGGPDWYADVHGYCTLPEAECRWENHTRTIDIQYLVSGSEGICWMDVRQLGPPERFLEEKDRQEFHGPRSGCSLIHMHPGMLALFMPGDAHCPKIALGDPEHLRKVVVKIPVRLIE